MKRDAKQTMFEGLGVNFYLCRIRVRDKRDSREDKSEQHNIAKFMNTKKTQKNETNYIGKEEEKQPEEEKSALRVIRQKNKAYTQLTSRETRKKVQRKKLK